MKQEIFRGMLTLQQAESVSAIRVDKLRKLIKQGRLSSVQVCGPYSPHLIRPRDLESVVEASKL